MTKATVTEICYRLAGGESLRSICRDDHMPSISTVMLWVVTNRDGFSEHYAQAREAAGYAHADRIVDVVELVATAQLEPNQAKAMMDGLKWAAERMAPKSHSARQEIDHTTGGEKLTPTRIVIEAATSDDNPSDD